MSNGHSESRLTAEILLALGSLSEPGVAVWSAGAGREADGENRTVVSSAKRRRRRFQGNFGDYQPTAHDVFACVYFKSGTNWLMQILVQVIHHGAAEFEHVHDIVPWPDSPDPRYAVPLSDDTAWKNSPTGLRVIKTHLDFTRVPFSPEARYVCVVRDPKDVCVSALSLSARGRHGTDDAVGA